MSALVRLDDHTLSAASLEHVLGTGDLSKLSTEQRVQYYLNVCATLGLNPMTRPFRFLLFQGNVVLYATRDCADQLRALRQISITITDQRIDGDLFFVTARATAQGGRTDEDLGAITIGQLRGEARANATMKAITKAKRRVTLSICGLGMPDETEVETLKDARVFDHDQEPPAAAPPAPPAAPRRTVLDYLGEVRAMLATAANTDDVMSIAMSDKVKWGLDKLKGGQLDELNALLADAMTRCTEDQDSAAEPVSADDDGWPGPKA